MKEVRLVVFNENYWDGGLILSQNLLPLVEYANQAKVKISLISFTSVVEWILKRKKIKQFKQNLQKKGVSCINYPVLFYPTRYMLLRKWLIPFFYLNVIGYIKRLNLKDKDRNIFYNLRSYQIAQGFNKFYKYKDRLIFDTRTDWIAENINVGNFSPNSKTVKFWLTKEKEMLSTFKKTLFISPAFKNAVLERAQIEDSEKFEIIYNAIDYNRFQNHTDVRRKDFLYTGSLGHWNNLETYLEFFYNVAPFFPNSDLIICTNTSKEKIYPILSQQKYDSIKQRVKLYFNVSYDELPDKYSSAAYGLQIMMKQDSRVGVKLVEYVAAGIIPIVHENVMGAVEVVNKYELGLVFNNQDLENPAQLASEIKNLSFNQSSEKYKEFKHLTDTNSISQRFSTIFK